ncbi:MAG: Gldg family protein, partial [Litorilinea sp.]
NSRFESIQRGVVDLRDLVYYASLCGLFLALNILALDMKRWNAAPATARYRRVALLTVGLIAANLLVLNIWLAPVVGARLDLTAQKEYTLSPPTRDLVATLQEPLLIRGHFSSRTHPLLAPLVPRIADTLREYEAASQGMIRVEIVDPAQDPELEAEAAQTYGIRPTPFQIADRYESAVVNAYFDILVRYGDQSEVLNFQDLIEVEAFRDGEIDVRLRNLEYDLTRAIQRTVYGFQDLNSILASLPAAARITLYSTAATLPPDLVETEQTVRRVAQAIADEASTSGSNAAGTAAPLTFSVIDPDDPTAPVNRQELNEVYGLQPFMVSLFSDETFYFHLVIELEATRPPEGNTEQAATAARDAQILYPTAGITEGELHNLLESGLQRFSSGFLQVVGIWQPPVEPDPALAQMGQNQPPAFATWDALGQILQEDYEVRRADLSTGRIAPDIDVLLLIAPQNLTDVERYAIDQFLMRGGAVVAAVANFQPIADPFTGQLTLEPTTTGIDDMLAHYGVTVAPTLVLDPQNEPFPVAVNRDVGGYTVQEIQSLNYPYFVDVRSDGMNANSALAANLPAITLNWVSPVALDAERTATLETATLLNSTPAAWTSASLDIQPNTELYPEQGFAISGEQQSYPLAVSLMGTFESYFTDPARVPALGESESSAESPTSPAATIQRSPNAARLVVVGSAHFLNDTVFTISSQIAPDRYLNSLRFVQNAVDWAVEDLDLLSIRARGAYARLLRPLANGEETFWELFNYGFAVAGLIVIGLTWANFRRSEQPMTLTPRRAASDASPEMSPDSPPDSSTDSPPAPKPEVTHDNA